MLIYEAQFEKIKNDKIAVIYEIEKVKKLDGSIDITKTAVKKDNKTDIYYLDPFKEYLILCARSEYKVIENRLERTFLSIRHPYYSLKKENP